MKSFTLSSLIPAFVLFLSLAASASIKRDHYSDNDSTICTSGFGRCYEVLGMAEACGLQSDGQGYSSGVTDETFLKCFCSANGFKPATSACSDAMPAEYRAEFNSLIKYCDEYDHYKAVRARSPLDVAGGFSGLPKPPK